MRDLDAAKEAQLKAGNDRVADWERVVGEKAMLAVAAATSRP